ncbi:MAG: DUF4258 domain-containing protein [Bacteroidota bacterium]
MIDSGFFKRLGWYLVGFSIGLIFLVFFVKKSGATVMELCYFPNCRVLKDIRSKPISYANGLETNFSKDSVLWYSFFKEGNIDFGASETKSEPCKTYIITNNENKNISLKNCPESVVVESLD